jgi:hypothetical protein
VTVAAFGLGTLRRIAGNYAEIAFDADKSESVRIILFEDIGAL